LISLDEALARWAASANEASDWGAQRAREIADAMAAQGAFKVLWEPGDEEWILLADEVRYQGMVSIHYPIALLTPVAATVARDVAADLDIVEITDFLDENLSANANLLNATALPHGWGDDFDPQAFCANDLFVESV
jgi:hypothetical protein